MTERFKVAHGSASAHCCFDATVIDTSREGSEHVQAVCECMELEDAERIAKALNEVRPAPEMRGRNPDHIEKLWDELQELAETDTATHSIMTSYRVRYPLGLPPEASIEMLLQLAIFATKEKARLLKVVIDTASFLPAPIIMCKDCDKLKKI